jgi:signal transduction histidine kinase/CheY-like chemotaxis protein
MDAGQEDIFRNLTSSDFFSFIKSIEQPVAFTDEHGKVCWFSDKFKDLYPKTKLQSSLISIFDSSGELESLEIPPGTIETDQHTISSVKLNDHYNLIYVRVKGVDADLQRDRIKLFKNSAHDLNNILTSIVNSASLLMLEEKKDSKIKRLIETLESNSLRAVDIVESILTDEIGRLRTKHKIKMNSLIEELQNSLKSITPQNVSISFEVNDNLEIIMGNYSDLYRVFLNLCINSSEAIEREGKIIVRAENITSDMISSDEKKTSAKYVKVSVEDNGSGIEEKNISRVFDSDFSTKNKDYNSGLGLSIVKEIISNHDGFIEIESELGKGTVITTYIPAREELTPHQVEDKSPRRILIADDENSILELLLDLFQSYGYDVLEAKDGSELIDLVKAKDEVDLYIIDRKIPAPDGLECISEIRKRGIDKPIILTTGSMEIGENPALQDLDITQILVKPYDFEELLKMVDGLLY